MKNFNDRVDFESFVDVSTSLSLRDSVGFPPLFTLKKKYGCIRLCLDTWRRRKWDFKNNLTLSNLILAVVLLVVSCGCDSQILKLLSIFYSMELSFRVCTELGCVVCSFVMLGLDLVMLGVESRRSLPRSC